jgi:hypothetical protein
MKNKTCKHCGKLVDLWQEGSTYRDGTMAHEECEDANEFDKANAFELAEREEW